MILNHQINKKKVEIFNLIEVETIRKYKNPPFFRLEFRTGDSQIETVF